MDREELETMALRVISPEHYYDLADVIGDTPSADLYDLISCNGDYDEELFCIAINANV